MTGAQRKLMALQQAQRTIAELEAFCAELSEGGDVALVPAIYEAVADRIFTSAELIRHAEADGESLTPALIFAGCGQDARKLGLLLKRLEGEDCSGFQVVREAEDRGGAIWRVQPVVAG